MLRGIGSELVRHRAVLPMPVTGSLVATDEAEIAPR
jgi:hypothetical protein